MRTMTREEHNTTLQLAVFIYSQKLSQTLQVVRKGVAQNSADLKNDVELGIEVRLEALALQDGLELVK